MYEFVTLTLSTTKMALPIEEQQQEQESKEQLREILHSRMVQQPPLPVVSETWMFNDRDYQGPVPTLEEGLERLRLSAERANPDRDLSYQRMRGPSQFLPVPHHPPDGMTVHVWDEEYDQFVEVTSELSLTLPQTQVDDFDYMGELRRMGFINPDAVMPRQPVAEPTAPVSSLPPWLSSSRRELAELLYSAHGGDDEKDADDLPALYHRADDGCVVCNDAYCNCDSCNCNGTRRQGRVCHVRDTVTPEEEALMLLVD